VVTEVNALGRPSGVQGSASQETGQIISGQFNFDGRVEEHIHELQSPWFAAYHQSRSASKRSSALVPGAHMPQAQPASVTLVLGGVRSGKSRYAQQLAEQSERVTFIATAERRDDPEMSAKIDRHRADRPANWTTIEEPLKLAEAIQKAGGDGDAVLVDCLTLFASNLLEMCGQDEEATKGHIDLLCDVLRNPPCPVILVSNEVGSGVVPAYELGRRFRDLVGEINQRVASESSVVLLMVAGLPFALKGSTPLRGNP
jgi:adenosylcobinamide kinase / adenosylcobinamide-phosphate guanylyltransferase